jgi:hypothetical protein
MKERKSENLGACFEVQPLAKLKHYSRWILREIAFYNLAQDL